MHVFMTLADKMSQNLQRFMAKRNNSK